MNSFAYRSAAGSALLLIACSSAMAAQGEWRSWGGDPGGTRYSDLRQIDAADVSRLERAWTYHTGEVATGAISTQRQRIAAFEATPLDIDGVLYFSTPSSRV